MDVLKEAGVTFGPPSGPRVSITREDVAGIATFSIDDSAEVQQLREKAEALAMQDARTKAERLIKLGNGRLGEIRSLQESQSSYITSSLRSLPPEQSARFDEIEINVTLQISFQMLSGAAQ